MVKALALLADLYKAGVLPRNFATVNNEEITTWMQQGRAAMTINPFARLVTYNDPGKGKYGGRFKSLLPPMAADLAGKLAFAPTVEFWSLVIPKNAKQKPLAWEMIRALSSKAGTTAMALNGNGPTRISTYADPEADGGDALCGRRGGGAEGHAASICRPSTSRPAPTTSSSRRRRRPCSASSRRRPRWTTR